MLLGRTHGTWGRRKASKTGTNVRVSAKLGSSIKRSAWTSAGSEDAPLEEDTADIDLDSSATRWSTSVVDLKRKKGDPSGVDPYRLWIHIGCGSKT